MGIHVFTPDGSYLGWHPKEGVDLLKTFGRTGLIAIPGDDMGPQINKKKVSHDDQDNLIISSQPDPDPSGFEREFMAIFSTTERNNYLAKYPLLFIASQKEEWPDVEVLLTQSVQAGDLNAGQKAMIISLINKYHIPVQLT